MSMNLLQIGELAGRLTPEFSAETRAEIDWRGMRNMRNMFAHDYGSMDYERIWETAIYDIPVLKAACTAFLKQMNDKAKTKSHRTGAFRAPSGFSHFLPRRT